MSLTTRTTGSRRLLLTSSLSLSPAMPRAKSATARRRITPAVIRSIGEDTPIMPAVVADCVVDELLRFVGSEAFTRLGIHRELADKLAQRAEEVYLHNATWRKLIRSRGNRGRDALYSFMRHWMADHIARTDTALYARFPAGYSTGAPLPSTPLARRA
jgi:hypothetical protein